MYCSTHWKDTEKAAHAQSVYGLSYWYACMPVFIFQGKKIYYAEPFFTCRRLLTSLQQTTFGNIVTKGEIVMSNFFFNQNVLNCFNWNCNHTVIFPCHKYAKVCLPGAGLIYILLNYSSVEFRTLFAMSSNNNMLRSFAIKLSQCSFHNPNMLDFCKIIIISNFSFILKD